MNLNRLRYFLAVADELHFGRAARRLHMAQPPLSQQIRQLETELGTDLFTRTTRRVELTSAGRALLPHATRLVDDADRIARLMEEQRSGDSGQLRLGFVDSSSYAVMPRLLRAYRERWPQVTFELRAMSSDAQRDALRAGTLDVGVARYASDEADLAQSIILEEPLYLAVGSGHRLASGASVTFAVLAEEPLIGFTRTQSPSLAAELSMLLGQRGVAYDPIIEADEYTTIIGLVAAGEGVAIVPETVRSFQPEGARYLPIDDVTARTRLLLITRADEQLRVVHQMREMVPVVFDGDHSRSS